ncbi:hypothetical protein CC80DRAFT_130706 [Byssothecium circinans]|uniref:Uncharacterized protein n=1 Tax=Byssothecium circinans TaxID=147558 RepID=A0A6A5TQK6_9PLEO|nr:hypothetical protein CC80DRAFT_130706 [Byssothecium circinans]
MSTRLLPSHDTVRKMPVNTASSGRRRHRYVKQLAYHIATPSVAISQSQTAGEKTRSLAQVARDYRLRSPFRLDSDIEAQASVPPIPQRGALELQRICKQPRTCSQGVAFKNASSYSPHNIPETRACCGSTAQTNVPKTSIPSPDHDQRMRYSFDAVMSARWTLIDRRDELHANIRTKRPELLGCFPTVYQNGSLRRTFHRLAS